MICLLVLELNGSHQHFPWSMRNEVILLLSIHSLLLLIVCGSLFWNVVVSSSFGNHLAEEMMSWLINYLSSFCPVAVSEWSVSLPHCVMVWPAVCDCGIPWSYSLTFLPFLKQMVQTQMKCLILQHFIWVFTVCQSTYF